ncbi:MAG: DUF6152 family protein, partial [Gammaproteobacteria bacterium]
MSSFAAILAIAAPLTSQAHHAANAVYDMTSLSELTGEVTTVSWRNPHIRMSLQVETPDGAEIWELEAGAINTVERLGVSTDDIRVGDRIRVAGYVSRLGQLS